MRLRMPATGYVPARAVHQHVQTSVLLGLELENDPVHEPFLLGIQRAMGDLEADATPKGTKQPPRKVIASNTTNPNSLASERVLLILALEK
jgi:hypothetical protein